MSLLQNIIPALTRSNPAPEANAAASTIGSAIKPAYQISETPEAYAVTVFLPGVAKDAVALTAEEGQLQIVARRAWKQPEGWTTLYRESVDDAYALVLTHDNAINADKIFAELRDGVLQLSLPKSEALKPRKIAIG